MLLVINFCFFLPVKSANFTRGHVAASLGHEAHSSLGVWGLEGVDVVDKGGLWGDLEITNHAVSLPAQIHQVGVRVVDGEHDTVGSVQLHHHDGVVQVSGCPEAVLPLAVLSEPSGEDQAVLEVNCSSPL